MSRHLNSSTARAIAESLWGTGGTSAERTNHPGAYWLSCSGHGGLILDASVLSQDAYEGISKYCEPHRAIAYMSGDEFKKLNHGFRKNQFSVRQSWTQEPAEFFVLEEDCDWILAAKFAGIGPREFMDRPDAQKHIDNVFWRYFDEANPAIAHQHKVAEARQNRDPDLIISALREENGVKVTTADEKSYLVQGYKAARDEYGTPWLSKCEDVQPYPEDDPSLRF